MTDLRDRPDSFPVVSSETAFRSGRVIEVRTDLVAMPDGAQARRDVVVHPGAVGVIALDEQDQVLLLQQYRHPVRHRLWEPPAGLLDQPGEDPLDSARRELFEEAHLRADTWHVLVDVFTTPGMCDEAVRIYLARDVRQPDEPRFAGEHEEADMPVAWVPLDEAAQRIAAGDLHNPLAVIGVLAALRARDRGWDGLRPADSPWPQMSSYTGSG